MQAMYSCMRCKTDVGFDFDYFDQPLPHTIQHACPDGEVGLAYRASPIFNNLPFDLFAAEDRLKRRQARADSHWSAKRFDKMITKGRQERNG
jgi:hypothetical protein